MAGAGFQGNIGAHDDCQRGLEQHLRVGVNGGDCIKGLALVSDDKVPGLLVAGGGGVHGGVEDGVEMFFSDGLGGELAHGAAGE